MAPLAIVFYHVKFINFLTEIILHKFNFMKLSSYSICFIERIKLMNRHKKYVICYEYQKLFAVC